LLTRRAFLQSASATATTAALSGRSFASPEQAPPTPLHQFDYNAVTLLPGPMHEQFDYHHRLLLDLDNDKLLKPFRERTGLPAPGEDMGGWYSNSPFFDPHGSFEGYVPGHSFGQYLSALSRAAAITGDPATHAKIDALVAGFAPTLTSGFYNDYTLPAYTFDKTCCGLGDAYAYAGARSAGPALEQALSAVLPHLPEKALSRAEMRERPHTNDAQTWDESYTLPENLFLAYRRTGKSAYRDAAIRFLEDDLYFNPLSEDINVLPGEHAYSHVNALSSAMQAYLTLGSQKHLRAATNGFRMIEAQSFATGGWGPGETLLRPNTDDLGHSLFIQPASFETPCGAYGHFKITRYLLCVTGNPHYGDSMERVLYNTILGAKPMLPDGSSFYYSDFTLTGHKSYSRDKWPCCSGTLPQIAADYGISTYLSGVPQTASGAPADSNGLSVILFVPSRVTFQHAGSPVTLTQQTSYPALPTTTLALELAKDAAFPVAIRIPAWCGPATRVLVNGKAVSETPTPGSFYTLRRTWHSGDRIEVEFDMPLRTEILTAPAVRTVTVRPDSAPLTPANGASNDPFARQQPPTPIRLAALLRGPVVFMATGAWPTEMREQDLLAAAVPTSGDQLTVSPDSKAPITFKPYTAIANETYRTYQPLRAT
jgi:DUF1680 family protein